MKKHLKWIIPVAIVLVLAIAAALVVTLGDFGPGQQATEPADTGMKVYWNVDRDSYWDDTERVSMRKPSSDRLYRIRMAVDGEQVDLFCDDKTMVDYIDAMEFRGLEVDENNHITKVLAVEEFTGGIGVYRFYIQQITDTEVVCSVMMGGKGQQVTVKLKEDTKVYSVGGGGPLEGRPGKMQLQGGISAILDENGYADIIYASAPFEASPVYYNIERMWSSTIGMSTRDSDMVGKFTIKFAVDGEIVELYTKDQKVVDQIDSFAAKCMHLEFDEEGYISAAKHARNATGGNTVASYYHVLEMNSQTNSFYAKKFSGSDNGSEANPVISNACKIFDVSGKGSYMGEPTELRLYDQVHCLSDPSGEVSIIFVISRFVDAEVYWNVERQYDSINQTTTRKPDGNGYYSFLLAVNGEQVTLRTNDKTIADAMDARAAKCFALEVEGDVIVGYNLPSSVYGGITYASWCDVLSIDEDGNVTAAKAGTTNYETAKLTAQTKVYDVSNLAGMVGEETELQVGDRIHGLRDFDKNLNIVYVVSRTVDSPMYWNVDRAYNSTTKTSKRVREADGYYHIRLLNGTKEVTYKTSSKSLVDKLDSYVAVGLKTSGNIITAVYKYDQIRGYTGGGFASWCKVTSVGGGKISAKDSSKSYTGTLAEDYVVYNVSSSAVKQGEKTSVRVGDKIHGVKNSDGKVAVIYVIEREVTSKIYWNVERMYDSTAKQTTRTPAEDGFYYFTMAVDGEQVTLKTDDKEVATKVDSIAVRCMGLTLKDDVILKAHSSKEVKGYTGGTTAAWCDVLSVEGNTVVAKKLITTDEDYGKVYTVTIPDGTPIYNGSTKVESFVGEKTTIKEADRIHLLLNEKGKVAMGFIVSRISDYPMYYNVTRMYDSTAKQTTRVPDAEGWYYITMANDGEQVELKTQDVKLVNAIDSRAARALGVKVEEGVITAVALPSEIVLTKGGTVLDYAVVTDVTDGVITAERNGKTFTATMAENCVVYNVTGNGQPVGAPTEVLVGDTAYAMTRMDGMTSIVYIVGRTVGLYTGPCELCGTDVQWKAWDGATAMADGDHWYLLEDVTVSATCTIKANTTVTMDLRGKNINASVRVFDVMGNFNLMDTAEVSGVVSSTVVRMAPIFYVRDNAVMNLYGGTLQGSKQTQAGIGAVSDEDRGTLNIYGGTLIGAQVDKSGGIIDAFWNAVVNVYGGNFVAGKAGVNGDTISTGTNVTLNLLGGTFTGGNLYAAGTVTVGGDVKIENLYLASAKPLTISTEKPLSGASVAVSLADTSAAFVTLTDASQEACFKAANEEVFEVVNQDGSLWLVAKAVESDHEHCLCGGIGAIGDHATCTNVTWEPWNGSPESGKYYYLTEDLTLSSTLTIPAGATWNLCLNGHNIQSTKRVLDVNGTLNLTDCAQEQGTISSTVVRMAPIFYVRDNATMNIYGGIFQGSDQTQAAIGGVADSKGGNLNIYGGTFLGANVTKSGGIIELYHSSVLHIYGGTFQGGSATNYADGINITAKSTAYIYGGTFSELYVSGKVTLGGQVQASRVRMAGEYPLTISTDVPLSGDAAIAIACNDITKPFVTVTDSAQEAFFRAADADTYEVVNQDNQLYLALKAVPHSHCVCNGLGAIGDHTACDEVVWEAWPGADNWESGKYYYLTDDVTLSAYLNIPKDKTLNLCLNGCDLHLNNSSRAFQIYGTLNLTDHAATAEKPQGQVTATSTKTMAPIFYVCDNATFNLYGGELVGGSYTRSGVGTLGDTATGGSKMNVYGGTVTGGTVTENGGAIELLRDSVLTIYGGTITGGRAKNGGNISAGSNKCKVYIHGGTITKGYGSNSGGNIYAAEGATLEITGGVISNGLENGAKNSSTGGNVWTKGNFLMTGGTITGGIVNGSGGNIRVEGGTATITGGSILGGISQDYNGGNIFHVAGTLTIKDDPATEGVPTITGGSAAKGNGGNIIIRGTAEIGACVISGGSAKLGDNIHLDTSGNLTLTGLVTLNEAGKTDIYMVGALSVKTLDTASRIGITMKTPGVFVTTEQASELVECFLSEDAAKTVTPDGNTLKLA